MRTYWNGRRFMPSPQPDATAAAVKLAEEMGVDLVDVQGTGKGGRILKSDVSQFIVNQDAGDDAGDDDAEGGEE